jgi:hypothetical protein
MALIGEHCYTPPRFRQYLDDALRAGTLPKDLAPHIISCYDDDTQAYAAESARIEQIGLKNLLNLSRGREKGAPHHPHSCDPAVCPVHKARILQITDERIVGHFARWDFDGTWANYPAVIGPKAFASLREDAKYDGCTTRGHALAWATYRLCMALRHESWDRSAAQMYAGFFCQLVEAAGVVIEANSGDLVRYHRLPGPPHIIADVMKACKHDRPDRRRLRDGFIATVASKIESLAQATF